MDLNTQIKSSIITYVKQLGIVWALIALVIIMASLRSSFLNSANLLLIFKQSSITGILAVGMAIVIISGGIDLSVGSVLAVCGIVASLCTTSSRAWEPLSVVPTFLIVLSVGAAFGAMNGFFVSYLNFPAFIVTMATLSAGRGIALVVTNGISIFNLSREFIAVSNSAPFGIPSLVYFWLPTAVIGHFLTKKTVFGKWLYAIGGNQDAARMSGVNVKFIKMMAYVLSGICAGLTGILMSSRVTSGQPAVGDGYELDAIASCVIGGVSMAGGSGALIGTIVGVLILTVISNGFNIMGLGSNYQKILKGVIIMIAVSIDLISKRRQRD